MVEHVDNEEMKGGEEDSCPATTQNDDNQLLNMQQDTQATSGNMDMMKTSLSKKKGTGFSAALVD